jgi:hypothetical protein
METPMVETIWKHGAEETLSWRKPVRPLQGRRSFSCRLPWHSPRKKHRRRKTPGREIRFGFKWPWRRAKANTNTMFPRLKLLRGSRL